MSAKRPFAPQPRQRPVACAPRRRSRSRSTGFASQSQPSRSAHSSASAPAPRRASPPPAASTSTTPPTPPPATRCSTGSFTGAANVGLGPAADAQPHQRQLQRRHWPPCPALEHLPASTTSPPDATPCSRTRPATDYVATGNGALFINTHRRQQRRRRAARRWPPTRPAATTSRRRPGAAFQHDRPRNIANGGAALTQKHRIDDIATGGGPCTRTPPATINAATPRSALHNTTGNATSPTGSTPGLSTPPAPTTSPSAPTRWLNNIGSLERRPRLWRPQNLDHRL